jgi:haloalkane dehalogenase
VAVAAFIQDIPMSPAHPSWDTLSSTAEGLPQFTQNPALVVWGGRDFCFNDHYYTEWRQQLPQAETMYLADAGHYVLADANAEVMPRIAAFLTQPRP